MAFLDEAAWKTMVSSHKLDMKMDGKKIFPYFSDSNMEKKIATLKKAQSAFQAKQSASNSETLTKAIDDVTKAAAKIKTEHMKKAATDDFVYKHIAGINQEIMAIVKTQTTWAAGQRAAEAAAKVLPKKEDKKVVAVVKEEARQQAVAKVAQKDQTLLTTIASCEAKIKEFMVVFAEVLTLKDTAPEGANLPVINKVGARAEELLALVELVVKKDTKMAPTDANKLRADFKHCFVSVVILSTSLKNHAHASGLLRQLYNRIKVELADGHIKEYLENTKMRCKA